MTTDAILERLSALHPKLIDLSLGRIERLLSALDNPERQLPPVVHVAGTNGKGSVLAFLRAFLEAAGYKVHVYTSPHLVRFNERIRLAGALIDDATLDGVLEECERANAGEPITFFEITTAAALLAFSRVDADIVLLETGLGGRLDATNVIAKPKLTAITQVAMDHEHFLGDDIEKIMAEKAGILKSGVPCIAAAQPVRKAEKVLTDAALEIDANLVLEGKDWFTRAIGGRKGPSTMLYKGWQGETEYPMPALLGRHQVRNAGLAIALAEGLAPEFEISGEAIAKGLLSVTWPGRLHHLTTGPLAERLPDGWELWLDGGHNKAAAEALLLHSRSWRDKPLYLVYGALNQRDPLDFLKSFEGRVVGLQAVAVPGEKNSLSADEAATAALNLRMEAAPAASVADAVTAITQGAEDGARILICGSLYLAGHVLKDNG